MELKYAKLKYAITPTLLLLLVLGMSLIASPGKVDATQQQNIECPKGDASKGRDCLHMCVDIGQLATNTCEEVKGCSREFTKMECSLLICDVVIIPGDATQDKLKKAKVIGTVHGANYDWEYKCVPTQEVKVDPK